MTRKVLSMIGVILILFVLSSCSSGPEQSLLKSYFNAVSLNDAQTMATMSLQPLKIEVSDWEIVNAGEELVNPATLPDVNAKELDLKKQVEDSVSTTLDSNDELDNAKFELENARTRAARSTIQKKVDELQTKYDEVYETHKDLQKQYNEAKAVSAREEEITLFSIGAGDIANIRDMKGDVHTKEVQVKCTLRIGGEKTYNVFIRRYVLQDELMKISRRGRWIIVNFVLVN
ncbi:MAG: hypothetical protein MUP70_05995 [Candidatus Aminicenantes bacterium]|nr:hypothetical protein [Candidatus Aminicenantes bacterium]